MLYCQNTKSALNLHPLECNHHVGKDFLVRSYFPRAQSNVWCLLVVLSKHLLNK